MQKGSKLVQAHTLVVRHIGSGVRIRRNGKLPFSLTSWQKAGDESTPAAHVTQSERRQWPDSVEKLDVVGKWHSDIDGNDAG
jgi:hypothetical protein